MYFNFHTHILHEFGIEILDQDLENYSISNHYSMGIHPKDALMKVDLENEIQIANCLAIGECGLDKLVEVDFETQKAVFIQQIELSEKYNLPVILHCVKAWNEVLEIKKRLNPKQKWIFHGFRKTTLLDDILKNGLMIGIGTAILYDEKLQDCLKEIPLNRLLLETDMDDKHTILEVYEKVAEIKTLSLRDLEQEIEKNFKETFTKWEIG